MDLQFQELSEQYHSKPEDYFDTEREEMLPFVPEHCRTILEVGCGAGAFAALLKKRRPSSEVWGVEPDRMSADIAASRLDRVINSTFSPDLPELAGRKFDTILFNDVLEHMVDPERVLAESRSLISQHGVVVSSLPNILYFYQISRILIDEDWKYEEWGIMDRTHLRFFTKKSIVRMFRSAGYEIARMEGINPAPAFTYRLANLLTLGRLRDWKYVQFAVQATPST